MNYTNCERDVRATNKADTVLAKADLDDVFKTGRHHIFQLKLAAIDLIDLFGDAILGLINIITN